MFGGNEIKMTMEIKPEMCLKLKGVECVGFEWTCFNFVVSVQKSRMEGRLLQKTI